jgi:hypothetical protein
MIVTAGIQHDGDSCQARHGFLEQLQALGRELRTEKSRPRDVAPGARKAGDQSARHHVAADRHDDGDRRRGLLHDPDARPARDDDVRLEADQLSGERGKPIILALRPPVLDDDAPVLDVAEVTESLPQGPDLTSVAGLGGGPEESDARHLSRTRLRLGGERRGQEAAREDRHEDTSGHFERTERTPRGPPEVHGRCLES